MNSRIKKIIDYIMDPDYRFLVDSARGKHDGMDDAEYLKRRYKAKKGKELNLDNPQTFDEKLQWLKINDRNPIYTTMVDKYEVKDYVANRIGEEYIIPTLGVWDFADEIDFDKLPDQFVLKCTHDSHGLVICKDKSAFNICDAKDKLNRCLSRNYYAMGREWPYKNVKPRIIAEKFMTDSTAEDRQANKEGLTDYKFYCFNGHVDCVMICIDRNIGDPKFYFFDRDWKLKRYNIRGKEAPEGFALPKPDGINEMFDIAEQLSSGIPFVRVDLYNVEGHIYFGELTFYPASGFDRNRLPETDAYFGNLLDISVVVKATDNN